MKMKKEKDPCEDDSFIYPDKSEWLGLVIVVLILLGAAVYLLFKG